MLFTYCGRILSKLTKSRRLTALFNYNTTVKLTYTKGDPKALIILDISIDIEQNVKRAIILSLRLSYINYFYLTKKGLQNIANLVETQ